jgi:hypothetical protein
VSRSDANIRWSIVHSCVALLLSCNYFAFQVELFEGEYEANHPAPTPSGVHSLSSPTITWESFDKDNAPQAFVVDAGLRVECLAILAPVPAIQIVAADPHQPVRDKSPPSLL